MGLKPSSFLSILAFFTFLILGVLTLVFLKTGYLRSASTNQTATIYDDQDDSAQLKLARTWQSYKVRFVDPDGRTIDRGRQDVTTAEGQSYTLLRAVWLNDQPTFDRVLAWTNQNLRARSDSLFATLWGRDINGRWTILDNTSSSRSAEDVALALLMAAQKWPEQAPGYQKQAQTLLNDLWNKMVITIGGKPYLTAGDWAVSQPRPTLNPAYFAPYAYRIFARYDNNPAHRWDALIDSSFEALYGCATLNEPSRLLPDWCAIEPSRGTYVVPSGDLSMAYGYQAFQGYWRLALDNQWSGAEDRRSREFLQWSSAGHNSLLNAPVPVAVYDQNGDALAPEDSTTFAGALGLRLAVDQTAAQSLYRKIPALYHELDKGAYFFWDEPDNYYQQNWLWLGVALYNQTLKPV